MRCLLGGSLLLWACHTSVADAQPTRRTAASAERSQSFAPAASYQLGAFLYLANDGSRLVYCSPLPDPGAVPVAHATVTAGGASGHTGWQGFFALPVASLDGEVAVDGQDPLTGAPIKRTAAVLSVPMGYGAVAGYCTRQPDGTLAFGPSPARQQTALFHLRVWLDGESCLPLDDGHFLFRGVSPGTHTLRAESIFRGQVHRVEATVEVVAGRTCVPQMGETSAESAPPLSFHWVEVASCFGSPTGFYGNAALVNANGRRPSNPEITMTIHTPWLGTVTETGVSELGRELGTIEDFTATATLGDFTISHTEPGVIIPGELRVRPVVNIDIDPNPVVIGKPALVRWTKDWGTGGTPTAGISLYLTDRAFGQTKTIGFGPEPYWLPTIPRYYPRDCWVLTAEQTSRLVPGRTYMLTVDSADTLDWQTIKQRFPTKFSFTAINEGDAPPPAPAALQGPVPVQRGTVNGWLYFAEPPGQHPVTDSLVLSPCPIPWLIPGVDAGVTTDDGAFYRSGREGHLHLEGIEPGRYTLSVAAENPTTGEFFTTDLTVRFVHLASYVPQDTKGTLIAYLYHTPGRVWVDCRPGAGPPLVSSRLVVDGFPSDMAQLQNALTQSDGRVQVSLPPGSHVVRFEGITEGKVWAAERTVSLAAGTTRSVNLEASVVGRAKPLNILGASYWANAGLDADRSMVVRAVYADGSSPKYNRFPEGQPLVTMGPVTRNISVGKVVDDWLWFQGPALFAGQWGGGSAGTNARFRVWTGPEHFGDPDHLVLETEPCSYELTLPMKHAMTPWIRTYPCPLVAGKPGIVYWGEARPHSVYTFSVRTSRICLDTCPPGDPFGGITQPTAARVRVLSRTETAGWLDPAGPYAPYQLCVTTMDSQFYNQQREHWLNYVGVQELPFETGHWLGLLGEHGTVKVNGVPQDLPWAAQLDHGTKVTLEAVPDRGYRFVLWAGQLDGTANPAELTVDGDKDVEARFEAFPPTLRWTDERGYAEDGVRPDAATSEQTFRFSVTYSSGDGSPPLDRRVKLRLQRFDTATDSWVDRPGATLEAGTGWYVRGKEYHGRVSLGTGKYRYRFVARSSGEGNAYVTGPPYQWTVGPVVNNQPVLEWAGTPGLLDQGVLPEQAAADTTFRFAVRYKDVDGDLPAQKRLHVQRIGRGGDWSTYRLPVLRERRGAVETGKLYAVRTTLSNGVYRYRFEMADYADAAGGPPAGWQLGPVIENAPPILTWAGGQAYEADGVDPNTGGPGRYAFRVNYVDGEGNAPVSAELVLKQPSGEETRHELEPAPWGNWRRGRQLRVAVHLHAPGQYEYRFVVRDRDGEASSFQAARGPHSGPLVSPDGGGVAQVAGSTQITALVATQTGVGAQVSFSLSAAARIEARVVNIAGRPVANIGRDRPCEAGRNTLIWNAMSAAGLPVPNGMYLVEVLARDDDGGQTRALTQVRLSR